MATVQMYRFPCKDLCPVPAFWKAYHANVEKQGGMESMQELATIQTLCPISGLCVNQDNRPPPMPHRGGSEKIRIVPFPNVAEYADTKELNLSLRHGALREPYLDQSLRQFFSRYHM